MSASCEFLSTYQRIPGPTRPSTDPERSGDLRGALLQSFKRRSGRKVPRIDDPIRVLTQPTGVRAASDSNSIGVRALGLAGLGGVVELTNSLGLTSGLAVPAGPRLSEGLVVPVGLGLSELGVSGGSAFPLGRAPRSASPWGWAPGLVSWWEWSPG